MLHEPAARLGPYLSHAILSRRELRQIHKRESAMQIHVRRAALAVVTLVEVGVIAGTALVWAFMNGWALTAYGPLDANSELGLLLMSVMIGGSVGAVAIPLLLFTLLRRTPLGRAVGLPLLGALLGLVTAAVVSPFPAITPFPRLLDRRAERDAVPSPGHHVA